MQVADWGSEAIIHSDINSHLVTLQLFVESSSWLAHVVAVLMHPEID